MNNNIIKNLIKIKNASLVRKELVVVENSTLIVDLLSILYKEGFIQSLKINIDGKTINVYLRYSYNKDLFKNFKIISSSSSKYYISYKDLCRLSHKKFILFLSTDKGFTTGIDCKKYNVGGKLCFVC